MKGAIDDYEEHEHGLYNINMDSQKKPRNHKQLNFHNLTQLDILIVRIST